MVKRKSRVSILQESAITASVSNETKIIEILESGGDLHSEVARSCWPDILGSYTDKEIKDYDDFISPYKKILEVERKALEVF